MLARDAMTMAPVVVTPGTPISRAAQMMRDWDVGVMPVVEDLTTMTLVGLITDRDIVTRCVADRHLDVCDVSNHMTTSLLQTVYPESSLETCMRLMKREQVRRLPVVDADTRLVGMLSLADVARKLAAFEPRAIASLLEQISEPAGVHV